MSGDVRGRDAALSFFVSRIGAALVLGFTQRRARTLVRLGVTEGMARRRKRFAYGIEDGSLDRFLARLLSALFHGFLALVARC